MDGIVVTKTLNDGGHGIVEIVVTVGVRTVFLDGIVHGQDGGVVATLGIDNAHAVNILHIKIDVVKALGTLDTCSKCLDGDEHPQ